MTVNDITNFSLSLNGNDRIDLPRTGINVSLADSIYRLSPVMTVTAPDPSGILLGTRAGGYGNTYDFRMDIVGTSVRYPFRVDHFEVSDLKGGTSAMSGTFRVVLTHGFMYQPSEMRAYKNQSPGDVITSLINEYGSNNFKSCGDFDTSSPLDMETIYNPNLTPGDFIDRILLPLSSSTTSEINNPFYAFIDAQNRFRYRTLKTMLQQRDIKILVVSNQQSINDQEGFDSDYIRATVAVPFSQEYSHIYDVIDSETYRIEDGELTKVDSSFKNIAGVYQYGFYDREKSTTQYMSEEYFQSSPAMLRLQAGINLRNRKSYLIDKLVVQTVLDLDLCAGTRVKLQSYYGNSNKSMTSYTGEYVIESSVHSWNSNVNSGTTQLVLGTPAPFITNTLISKKAYTG